MAASRGRWPSCAACSGWRNDCRPAFAGAAPLVCDAEPLATGAREMTKPPRHDQAPGASKADETKSTASASFCGTDNPRYLRILAALLVRPRTRESLDRIAGASNGPDAIASLRAMGLPAPGCLACERTPVFDRDGREVMRGVYWLTPAGRTRVQAWMRRRDAQCKAAR